jgi:hypothetical protein
MPSNINLALLALIFWMCFQGFYQCYHGNDIIYFYEVTDVGPMVHLIYENGTTTWEYLRGNFK